MEVTPAIGGNKVARSKEEYNKWPRKELVLGGIEETEMQTTTELSSRTLQPFLCMSGGFSGAAAELIRRPRDKQ